MKYLLLLLSLCLFGCLSTQNSWLIVQRVDGQPQYCWKLVRKDPFFFHNSVFWYDRNGKKVLISGDYEIKKLNMKNPYETADTLNVPYDACLAQ